MSKYTYIYLLVRNIYLSTCYDLWTTMWHESSYILVFICLMRFLGKFAASDYQPRSTSSKSIIRNVQLSAFPCKPKARTGECSSLTWTEKYKPKVPNEIIGNQTIVWNSSLGLLLLLWIWFPFKNFHCYVAYIG